MLSRGQDGRWLSRVRSQWVQTNPLPAAMPHAGLAGSGLPNSRRAAALPNAGLPATGLPAAGLPAAGLPGSELPGTELLGPADRSAAVTQAALACAGSPDQPPSGALVFLIAVALDSTSETRFTAQARAIAIERWNALPPAEREWWQDESPPDWLVRQREAVLSRDDW